ncbi:uncharacterized protein K02A2.6-like [Galendromus occidentalis]|uniref:RNA-directed DNA polymerase n=1 Tax=Galendromus occidentalis TaxID=34638 RepID=A0AAJ7L6U2_9ACAR|nr:uncharacterized protein K02A2.6-like [Galendromus occidentalis]
MLAIVFGCSKFHYYVFGQKQLLVQSDHKPLEMIMKKPLHQVPLRLQRMHLTLQRYDIKVQYVPGRELLIADCLSRNPSADEMEEDPRIAALHSLPVADHRLPDYVSATQDDRQLKILMQTCLDGWPGDKKQVPQIVREYWPYRDEMHVENGLVMRSNRIVIPAALRSEVLRQLHQPHTGVNKMRLRARTAVYWPAIDADIEATVAKCQLCQRDRPANPREPMCSTATPPRPWYTVYMDLFEYEGDHFLIVVDAYSFYWDMTRLTTTTMKGIATASFAIFSHFGLPVELRSDNGPQFVGSWFRDLLNRYGIKQTTSSPYYPRGNSLAERAVQEAKKMLKKFTYNSPEYFTAMLELRNVPRNHLLGSPSQRLMGREARSTVPVPPGNLRPHTIPPETVIEGLDEEKRRSKFYYDRGTKPQRDMSPGQSIRILNPQENIWKRGTVVQVLPYPRSYLDEESGVVARRNRQVLREDRSAGPKEQEEIQVTTNETGPPGPPSMEIRRSFSRANGIRRHGLIHGWYPGLRRIEHS